RMARRRQFGRDVRAVLFPFAKSFGSRSAAAEPEGSGALQNWARRASFLGFLSSNRRNPLKCSLQSPLEAIVRPRRMKHHENRNVRWPQQLAGECATLFFLMIRRPPR